MTLAELAIALGVELGRSDVIAAAQAPATDSPGGGDGCGGGHSGGGGGGSSSPARLSSASVK